MAIKTLVKLSEIRNLPQVRILSICIVILTTFFFFNSRTTADETGLWLGLNYGKSFNAKWRGSLIIQPRWGNSNTHIERVVIRPSATLAVKKDVNLTFGYDSHFIHEPSSKSEHRLWQQLQKKWLVKNGTVTGNIRIEERRLEGISDLSIRPRFGIRAKKPLAPIYLATSILVRNEIFYHLNSVSHGPQSGFDQNRFFIGAGFTSNKDHQWEFGYQHQLIDQTGQSDTVVHQLMLNLQLN